jgi:uncharacterized membrane protein YidH (DUF202 family)
MASPGVPIVIGGLFAWSIYRRIRRNIGRQPLRPTRSIVSLVIMGLVTAWLITAAVALQNLNMIAGIGGGLVVGVALGFVGLKLTKFDTTEQGHFYTPDTRIGIALSLLLVGRIAYRMWQLQSMDFTSSNPQMYQSPLTYFILGLVLGYYFVYRIGLLVHTHDKPIPGKTTPPPPPTL